MPEKSDIEIIESTWCYKNKTTLETLHKVQVVYLFLFEQFQKKSLKLPNHDLNTKLIAAFINMIKARKIQPGTVRKYTEIIKKGWLINFNDEDENRIAWLSKVKVLPKDPTYLPDQLKKNYNHFLNIFNNLEKTFSLQPKMDSPKEDSTTSILSSLDDTNNRPKVSSIQLLLNETNTKETKDKEKEEGPEPKKRKINAEQEQISEPAFSAIFQSLQKEIFPNTIVSEKTNSSDQDSTKKMLTAFKPNNIETKNFCLPDSLPNEPSTQKASQPNTEELPKKRKTSGQKGHLSPPTEIDWIFQNPSDKSFLKK